MIFQYFTFLVINRTLFSIKSKSVNNPSTPYFRTFVCFDLSNLVSWDICSTFYPLLCHFCQLFSFELSESYINSAPFCETKKGDLCIFLRITNLSTAKGVMLFAHKRGKTRPLLTYAFSTSFPIFQHFLFLDIFSHKWPQVVHYPSFSLFYLL